MLDRTRNVAVPKSPATHVPRTMFAAAIDHFGGPEVISGHALPVPPLDADEVLIAVDTAGVGHGMPTSAKGALRPASRGFQPSPS